MPEKAAAIELLEHKRQVFLHDLEKLDLTRLDAPFRDDGWAVKDILSHLNGWEVLMRTWIESAARSVPPDLPASGEWETYIQDFNQRNYQENHNRPAEAILEEFYSIYPRLLQELKALPDDPSDMFWRLWRDARLLWRLVEVYAEHYQEHALFQEESHPSTPPE